MGPIINAMKNQASTIMSNIIAIQPDAQFGVGNYKDFPPSSNPYAFLHQLSITDDTSAVSTAIGTWVPLAGGDGPEGQFYALTELATNPAIGWRTDSTKIVVWFGDAPGHDPIPQAATGYDYDVDETTVIEDLQAAGIMVIPLSFYIPPSYPDGLDDDPNDGGGEYAAAYGITENGAPGQATRIASETGGIYMFTPNPEDVATVIIDALEQVVTDVWWQIGDCDDELKVTLTPSVHLDVPGGTTVPFVETIELDTDAVTGIYSCIVEFYANHYPEEGALIGTQEIKVRYKSDIDVDVDIKPGSCPNPIQLKKKGVTPAAICGTEDFDVMDIDPYTIMIGREGYGEIAPIRYNYGDVATPFPDFCEKCDDRLCCHELRADKYLDLTLKFSTPEIVSALLHDTTKGDVLCLYITGTTYDGLPFIGQDVIWIR
jgi:hypothetical protein